ncbi:IucA/IucC family protein [Saccharothrix violaceirubra]|uniref:Siderophore synthetase component n=1 Tax=Saccharothrix violaceirubra TaxID=413306 RepID=A0A7W7T1Z4_9PSEU|nr:IucA/IucC family protein [Saccharothrix violaceirubra]MBB4964572.1 siderophore synthetase component [Saccharothrix violaceirubra]
MTPDPRDHPPATGFPGRPPLPAGHDVGRPPTAPGTDGTDASGHDAGRGLGDPTSGGPGAHDHHEGRVRPRDRAPGRPLLDAGDPLCGPPGQAAAHAHLEALLRCWTRERDVPVHDRVRVEVRGGVLAADVRYASPTGRHRFGVVTLDGRPVDPVLAAALVAARLGGDVADLVERVAESVRRVEVFVEHRRREPVGPADRFLEAEQRLLLGHLHHPAPKSRDGISAADNARFSPELRGSFPLFWFSAAEEVVSHGAVDGPDTPSLLAALAGRTPEPGRVLVPAHPWQARDLVHRPRIASLISRGLLEPLGESGPAWSATSSLRTVYRTGSPVMLKLSLGLRITNSRRESTATELRRGSEIHRLLDTGFAAGTLAAHPAFDVVRDPAWLAVDEGGDVTGLDVALRKVPSDIGDSRCLAGLVAPRPGIGRTLLGELVLRLDAARWVADYTDHVLVPMLRLYAETGIGLEAHQQNTLVRVDRAGRVVGGRYRDNQGYYLAASHLPRVLGHLGVHESTLAVVDDAIVDDRLTYYLLRNQALAVIGCLGEEGLADERDLLAVMAARLEHAVPALARAGPDGDRLAKRWLSAESLPCKANLLTRLAGIDEVLAPLDNQSVYFAAPNPLREGRCAR